MSNEKNKLSDIETLDTVIVDEDLELSPTKLGPTGSGYGPILSESFDIKLDNKKKKVIHYVLLAILFNTGLFLYAGPTPFSKMSDVESDSISAAFYFWDVAVMIFSIITLFLALSRRAILNTHEMKVFKMKMIAISVCQIANGFLVIIEAGLYNITLFSMCLRIMVMGFNLMVWKAAKELELFYKLNRPVFY